MNLYLLIPLGVIFLLFCPIHLEGRGSFNALKLSGAIGVFVFNIKLEHQQFRIEKRKIVGVGENDQEDTFDFDQKDLIFTKMLIGELQDKTRPKELFVVYNLGLGDAFATAMVAGVINSILTIIMVSIKNYKPTASLGICDTISYNRQVAQFAVTLKIAISLFDVVYSFLRSVILTKKKTNELKLQEKQRGVL